MVMAADLSVRMGYVSSVEQARLVALVKAAGLPTVAPDLGGSRWLDLMEVDKKNEDGQIKFILLKPLGSTIITAAPTELLTATLTSCTHP
jgi:3-dehydroquinate synthase